MNLTTKKATALIILSSAIAASAAEPLSVTTKSGVTATLYGFASLNAAYEDSKSNAFFSLAILISHEEARIKGFPEEKFTSLIDFSIR